MIVNKDGWVEATIVINGVQLDFAQSMSVRVAVSSFRMSINSPNAPSDLGLIASVYDRRLAEVEEMMRKSV